MKNNKSITLGIALLMTALVINVCAIDKTPASFDFNIQNLTQDSVITVQLTTPNPKWSGTFKSFPINPETGKPVRACEDIGDCPNLTQTIKLSPGDQPYIEQDVQLVPGNFEIFVTSKNVGRKKLLSGPLTFKGLSQSGPEVGHFHGKSYTYDLKYDKSTHEGKFGFILEDGESEL